jgi:predicted transposase YbfD/YdcC
MSNNTFNAFDNVFIECFGTLEDKRYKNKQHRLVDVVAICICATLSGMTNFIEIYEFAIAHEKWFKKYLLLPYGIPSHDTLNGVMSSLEPKVFNDSFLKWLTKLKDLFPENVIPIDGKTLRRSHSKNKGLKALHIVNAYSCANGITLGQVAVDAKSNEITAIPELLKMLVIKGAIITIDAIGMQKEIAKQIIDSEADYVLAVKNNQRELSDATIDIFGLSQNNKFNKNLMPSKYKHEITGDHGRIEERFVYALPASTIGTQTDLKNWAGIESIVKVEHMNLITHTTEIRYYISSIAHTEIKKIAEAIRSHWCVENNLHWVLDVVFKEDDSRLRGRIGAQNVSWMRKMAIYLLKQDTSKGSMNSKMIRNCINPNNIIKLFGAV